MFNNSETVLIFILTLLAITLIATIGALLSRKLGFEYSRLSLVSFAFYVLAAYLILKNESLGKTILYMSFLGFYDGTIGLRLALLCDARIASKSVLKKTPLPVFALIGIGLAVITTLLCAGVLHIIT